MQNEIIYRHSSGCSFYGLPFLDPEVCQGCVSEVRLDTRSRWEKAWDPPIEEGDAFVAHTAKCGDPESEYLSGVECDDGCCIEGSFTRPQHPEAPELAEKYELKLRLVNDGISMSHAISRTPGAEDLGHISPQRKRLLQLADNLERPSKELDCIEGIIRGEIHHSERGKEQLPWHIRRALGDPKLERLHEAARRGAEAQHAYAEALRDKAEGMTGSCGDHYHPDWMDRLAKRMLIEGYREEQYREFAGRLNKSYEGTKVAWIAARDTEARRDGGSS